MYKRILAAVLAVLSLLGAVSCRKQEPDARRILHSLLTELGVGEGACTVYDFAELTANAENAAFFSSLYRRAPLELHLDAAKDFAAALSKKDDGFEIEIFISKHRSGREELRELLERRIELLRAGGVRNYLYEEYEGCLSSVQIYEKGNCVVLLATGQNERAAAILDSILK